LGERRLERREARIELGTEGVELALSGGGEVLSDRFGQRRQAGGTAPRLRIAVKRNQL